MVMGHMRHNGLNARRAVEAVLEALSEDGGWEGEGEGDGEGGGLEEKEKGKGKGDKWKGSVGVVTASANAGEEAKKKLGWLFEGRF